MVGWGLGGHSVATAFKIRDDTRIINKMSKSKYSTVFNLINRPLLPLWSYFNFIQFYPFIFILRKF